MAEEKLGTLQYDMIVSEEKLEASLKKIDQLLINADKRWKESLSNIGTGNVEGIIKTQQAIIELSKSGNVAVAANKRLSEANFTTANSYKALEKEIKKGIAGQKKLSAEDQESSANSIVLKQLQQKIDLYAQFKEALNQEIKARKAQDAEAKRKEVADLKEIKRLKELEQAAKSSLEAQRSRAFVKSNTEEQSAKTALESQRSKAFVKSNLDEEKRITDEIKKQESALRSLEAQRSKAFVRGEVEKEKQITREIKEQQAAIRSLESQRSKAFVASQTKQLREEQAATKALWQEQKLKLAVDQQAAGSIERLRAQYALLKFQLSQVKFSDPNAIANVQRLQTAISGVKSEIQALQPTLGIWGKLTSAIRTYATAYLSVQAVLGLGRAIYNQTKELDSLNFSMKTVIKSSTELAQTQKFLSDVAVNYGGDLLTLSERYIKFRAAAVQSNMSASETQKIFESVSKAAGTLGLKTDELSGVYLALEQMISKGKVTTEELRRQLGERLPGAFGIMANALGVTIPELDKLLKKGEILSTVALPKFAAALEKAYGIESLKKIDTLAAAQGRMSTEFTGLIKAMGASDTFKNSINAMASFIGFVKDNIGTITLFTKGILVVTAASLAYRLESALLNKILVASNIIKATYIGWTTKQIVAIEGLTGASLRAAEAQNLAASSTSRWSAVTKTFGGWVGVLVNILIGAIAYFALFRKSTDDTVDSIKTFNENLIEQYSKVNALFSSLESAKKGSNEYKDALFEINNQYSKYLPNLLTEKSGIDEVSKARNLSLLGLRDELTLKEKRAKLEAEYATQETFSKNLTQEVAAIDPNLTAYQKGLLISMIKDMGEAGVNETEVQGSRINKQLLWFVKQLNLPIDEKQNIFTSLVVKIRNLTDEAIKENRRAEKAVNAIRNTYKVDEPIKPITLDLTELKDAEEEFKKFDALQKLNKERGLKKGDTEFAELAEPNYTERFYSYKNFLITKRKEFLSQSKEDISARESIDLKLAEIDKKYESTGRREDKLLENRNEAIRKLNDKYLADQEDFANYEMGIQSTRIANMEDGLDKEIKLNELAYENRIKAIEKEKIATVKLLNEAAGVKGKIVGFDATGYSQEVQDAANAARDSDLQKRKNAENDLRESNLKSEKDYQIKINEIRRDANDQFLSGLEKERAAINEKYDEWVRKAGTNMKLIAEIEKSRDVALSEIYIQNQIDQLDFVREIEYKKNEIRLSGSARQRKLEKENFEVYVKYERERIKLLKSSVSIDKQREGFNKEQQLAADEALLKIKQQQELESDILEGAQKISEEYIKQAGLTGESAENLQLAVSTLQSIAKGDYLSAALGVLSKIFTSFSTENENEMLDYFEQLKVKISAVVDKISTLNSVLAKMGSTSSVVGVKLLQSEMAKLANDAARLNEQLKEIAASDEGRRRGTIIQGATTNGGRSDATEIESSRKRIVTDLIKQTDYLNQQIIMLSNKLLDPNLTEDQRKAVESVLNGYIEIVDAIDASIQSITGTSINELSNSIVDAFLAGENAAEAWGNKVTDIIRYMVKQQLVAQLLTKPITQAIQTLVADSEDTLTPEEALKFKDTIRGITEDVSPAIAAAAEAMKQVGIDLSSATTSSGISKGIQALTEDTGRRLEGLINSIRESGVTNIGNTKQLVESSQMIQGYAAQSLGHLRNIDMTTSEQLKLLNSVVFNGHSKGGAGIKTFTD